MSSETEAHDPSVAYDATPPQAKLREEEEFILLPNEVGEVSA